MRNRKAAALFLVLLILASPVSSEGPVAAMQVVLLGTGFPRPDPERFGPAAAVVIGEKVFVVDAGRGVVLRLAAAELPLKSVRAV
ncbi:MAG: hypothetical protein ACRD3R_17410, partial [Terriglobales bacterium]